MDTKQQLMAILKIDSLTVVIEKKVNFKRIMCVPGIVRLQMCRAVL